jgi:hypothetical protein
MKALTLAVLLALASPPALAGQTDPAPAAKLDPRHPDAMRCRKFAVIGSLVKKERICKTNAEWAKLAENGNREADSFINDNRGRNVPSQ